jgi:hypothetical protein
LSPQKGHGYQAGLAAFDFSPLNGFFDGILGKLVKPFIVKGLFCPDYRFCHQVKLILTGFTDVPVGDMKIITSHHRLVDSTFTDITGQSFHRILLKITKIILL